ncbi:transmembrane protein, putative (macronuclear) [Tetrahymena thermophila SB210]|uniref:Transmembrane protein, putative n=1 Tax=Tetrahymena thermophila (strain SB210) TaxID=312017 RepID=W7XJX9_TETTS|nr:transmembrane protein, putative [Tetrahymena thermophila SB210]EWS76041.1 transmembrane protein, putative [Tetrahymena thermophila SB210]|eukprot:XP_012651425.1 transmembrane protein, putative [Tetrahymena thermophila SB210]
MNLKVFVNSTFIKITKENYKLQSKYLLFIIMENIIYNFEINKVLYFKINQFKLISGSLNLYFYYYLLLFCIQLVVIQYLFMQVGREVSNFIFCQFQKKKKKKKKVEN